MDTSGQKNAEDVFRRFLAVPEDLEVVIDNKKIGVASLDHSRWDECDLETLEAGMALIKHKKKVDFYKNAGDLLFSLLFIIIETYIVLGSLGESSIATIPLIMSNLKLLAIGALPLLFIWETVNGGETSILPVRDNKELGVTRVFRRESRIIIFSIIIIDLINLFCGSLI